MRVNMSAAAALATLALAGCMASTQQEVQMGADYARQVEAQLPIVRDPEAARYLALLGNTIAERADDRGLQWSFKIVDAPEINAFAVPGGFIYVNRGLIERAATMSELAGVLGHEIAHVTMRHSMDQMRKAQGANLLTNVGCLLAPSVCNNVLGSLAIQAGGMAAFAKFSRDDEAEADRMGIAYVVRAGIDPRGVPAMFRTLQAEQRRNPSALEGWFASHPMAEDRAAESEKLIAQIDPVILQSLTTDTEQFRAFRRRLAGLPRAPGR
jgi:predicted Zn-dependent protease